MRGAKMPADRPSVQYMLLKFWNFLIVSPVSALVVAFVASGIIITLIGYNPFLTYGYLLVGAFGSVNNIVGTLGQMTPVLFTGLAFMLANRASLSNLGMEGQFLGGAMASALIAVALPGWVGGIARVLVALLAGALVGGLIALIPAILKRLLSSSEMLISLMLNYVVDLFTVYLLNYVVQNPDNITPATTPIPDSAKLPQLVHGSQLTVGFIIAISIAVICWVFLYKTVPGYRVRAIGSNESAAGYKGINAKRTMMWVMIASGAIAGLGGAVQIQGVHYSFIKGMSPGYGWDGVSAALLGGGEPLGTVLGTLVFGALRSGSMYLGRMYSVPSDFIYMLEGSMLFFIAAPTILHRLKRDLRRYERLDG